MSLKSLFHVQRWGPALILVLAPSIALGLIFRLGPDARALVDINLAYCSGGSGTGMTTSSARVTAATLPG